MCLRYCLDEELAQSTAQANDCSNSKVVKSSCQVRPDSFHPSVCWSWVEQSFSGFFQNARERESCRVILSFPGRTTWC